jgi:hypothetical protein
MADDFVKVFAPVEGLVVSAQSDTMYIDLGESTASTVVVGQELTVFRKGDTFTHPFTGKILGRYEEVLGHARIRRVHPMFSEAHFLPLLGRPTPRPEDGVRITRGRMKVAITPVLDLTSEQGDLRRVPYLLASALERSKRFQVVDPLAVADMFATGGAHVEEVLARPERATRIAKNLDVVAWLVSVLLERRGVVYLDMTWVSAVSGQALFSRRVPLLPPSAVEEQRFPWEPRAED